MTSTTNRMNKQPNTAELKTDKETIKNIQEALNFIRKHFPTVLHNIICNDDRLSFFECLNDYNNGAMPFLEFYFPACEHEGVNISNANPWSVRVDGHTYSYSSPAKATYKIYEYLTLWQCKKQSQSWNY